MKKMIDVSAYQGHINWQKVKEEGYDVAILRLGLGDDVKAQDDIRLSEYIKGCEDNNIRYGFYFVTYAQRLSGCESVESEIEHTERLIKDTNPFAIFYDVEVAQIEHLGKGVLTIFCDVYCGYFKQKGYNVGVYANKNWFTNYLDYDYLKNKGYLIWLAHYGIDSPSLECDIWQYSENGHLEGIGTNTTDLNYLYNESILNSTNQVSERVSGQVVNNNVNVYYKVKTQKHGWLSEVKNLEDYAGWEDSPISNIAIKVDKGSIKYRVHVKNGDWLPYVTGYDTNDNKNGYAGNDKIIDLIEVYYNTPNDIRPFKKAKYKVNNYSWQYDNEKTNCQDGYAGVYNKAITKFQIVIE